MNSSQRGLTLIALMVVVSVISILAALAYPSYQSVVRKGRRQDALGLLQAAQLAQEKYRLSQTRFARDTDLADAAFSQVCRGNATSPCLSAGGFFALSVSAASDASSYTLTATAQGDQARDSACATITVAQTASGPSYTPSTCWSK